MAITAERESLHEANRKYNKKNYPARVPVGIVNIFKEK